MFLEVDGNQGNLEEPTRTWKNVKNSKRTLGERRISIKFNGKCAHSIIYIYISSKVLAFSILFLVLEEKKMVESHI